jgi:hypothetical protein
MKPLKFQEYIRESANASSIQSALYQGSNTDTSFDDLLFNNIIKTDPYTLVKESLVEDDSIEPLETVLAKTSQILEKVKEIESEPITSGPDQVEDQADAEEVSEIEPEPEEEVSRIEMDPLSYKIFRDRAETFECKVHVEGASLSNTKVRLLIKSSEWNLYFDGKMGANGRCTIPLKKISILSEGLKGTISLEVTVDDTVFYPWEETFQVQASKKVKVEILSNRSQKQTGPKVTVSGI